MCLLQGKFSSPGHVAKFSHYSSPEKLMEMTNSHDSDHERITSRTKEKHSCTGETFPISSGGFVPSEWLLGAAELGPVPLDRS